ncbi:hypothetical protein II906_13515, partial [bacterium]|nr:hypothetical protein [bacterium]
MNKKLFSIMITSMLIASTACVFADTTPAIQYAPAEQANEYQTQYPVPANNYQTQGYSAGEYNNPQNYNNVNQQQLQGNVIF